MPSLTTRILAVPVVIAVVLAGIWVTGGVVTSNFRLAQGLTGAWLALAGLAALLVGLRVRGLRVPVIGAYLATAAAATLWLASTTLLDRTVDEAIAIGTPAAQADGETARMEPASAPSGPIELAAGDFTSVEHETEGRAAVVELEDGRRVVTLRGFETSPGPDLRVVLLDYTPESDADVRGGHDLGALKGNRGDQQYDVPAKAEVGRGATVLIWCRLFSARFAQAPLQHS